MKLNDLKLIAGSGGGGGDNQHTPVEASDTLRAKQIGTIIDALCEGPIVGLVNGLQSVFLNDTPLQNLDGTYNFKSIMLQQRLGTQNQTAFDGISDVEYEIGVGVQVKYNNPITRTLTATTNDAVRVTLSTPALSRQETNGDINGSSISFSIAIQPASGGGFVTLVTDTITGKTTSKYPVAYLIKLPGTGPWDIRVTRTMVDSSSAVLQDQLYFDSFTGIANVKLSYANTAVISLRLDSSEFRSIPTRAYGIKGLIISVPTNYNPTNRSYTGIWDGTFKQAWTDNPAWVFYDILTARRYALGDLIDPTSVDKWNLYQIAQYCDQLVPDGYGRQEPRFTCNLYLQTREDAYKVIQNLASIFRGITFWGAGGISSLQDRPANPIMLLNNANVIDGSFNYPGTSVKQRHTVALVTYNDPQDFYRPKIEYVQDDDGIKQYGAIDTQVVAFGCASRGQAHRMGKWMLATERYLDETITFRASLDSISLYPGAVFSTSDVNRSGTRMGGRLVSASGLNAVLDTPFAFDPSRTYSISLIDLTGVVESTPIINPATTTANITLTTSLANAAVANAVYILAADNLVPELWRVIGISENDPATVTISGLKYVPGVYDNIESAIPLMPRPISNINAVPDTPTNLATVVSRYSLDGVVSGLRCTLSWTGKSPRYRLRYRKANGPYIILDLTEASVDINNVDAAYYTFEVTAISGLGVESAPATLAVTLAPAPIILANVTGLYLNGPFTTKQVKFHWNTVPGAVSYEVQITHGSTPEITARTLNIGDTLDYSYSSADMRVDGGPFRAINFKVRAIGVFGSYGNFITLSVSNPQIPALSGITLTSGINTLFFNCSKPTDDDFVGIEMHISQDVNFTPSAATLVYDGPTTFYVFNNLDSTKTYYIRAAGYDDFGKDGMIFGGSITTPVFANAPSAGSISSSMLQSGIMDIAKFAAGVEPIGSVATLPSPLFTRASGATYIESGLVKYAVVNEPRKQNGVALVEAQGTNYLLQSTSIGTAPWIQISTGNTNVNFDIAPDGTSTASQLVDSDSGNLTYWDQILAVANDSVSYTFSCFVKAGTAAKTALVSYLLNGTTPIPGGIFVEINWADHTIVTNGNGTISSVGNGWYRLAISITNNSTGNNRLYSRFIAAGINSPVSATGSVYAWGAQTEQGLVATSVIPTTTYAVTRFADVDGYKFPRVVFLTSDSKLYRINYAGPAWTAAVAAPDISGTLADAQIAALSASKIAGLINDAQIAALGVGKLVGQITASQILASTITTTQIAANTITAANILAGSITGDRIMANTLTAANILAGSITGDRITANTITAGLLTAGAITVRELAAGAVTASKLAIVAQGGNLGVDPYFIDFNGVNTQSWTATAGFGTATMTGTAPAMTGIVSSVQGSIYTNTSFPVDSNKVYRLSAHTFSASQGANDRSMYLLIDFFDAAGTRIGTSWGGSFSAYPVSGFVPTASDFVMVQGTFGVGQAHTIPVNVKSCKIGAILQYGGSTGGPMYLTGLRWEEVLPGTLIADGAITTNKITVGSLNADRLLANSITAGQIAANTITGDRIVGNTITGNLIAASTIQADKLLIGGRNLLPNAGPAPGTTAGFGDAGGNWTGTHSFGLSANVSSIYVPEGGGGVYTSSGGAQAAGLYWNISANYGVSYPCTAGKTYEVSAYISAHRCNAFAFLIFYDSTGALVSYLIGSTVTGAVSGPLSNWNRSTGIGAAPAGAVSMRVYCQGVATTGSTDPYIFCSNWYMSEAMPGQTVASPWSASASTTIDGSGIRTNTVTADRMNVGNLSAISANMGTLTAGTIQSAAGGQRYVMTEQGCRFYDIGGTLRGAFGNLS